MKIKHIVLGFFGALFVTTLIFQAPILAWAQNTTLWYGSQGGKVWTLASGGTIAANSGSTVTLAGTNTVSGTLSVTGSTFGVSPFMTYAKCGKATIALDSTGVYVAVTGVVSTDCVLATVAKDTALTVRAIPSKGYIRLVASGAPTDSTGLPVSWAVIRPQ